MAPLACLDQQRQQIALAVAHAHQPRGGQLGSEFGQPLVAFDPAHALQQPASAAVGLLGLARPHPGVEHAQRHALRTHRIRRVQVHPALRLVAQRPEPVDGLAVEVQLGGVVQAQHYRLGAHAPQAAGQVRREDVAPAHGVVRQQPVRGLGLGRARAGRRNAHARLLG
jgi:hypothetical protein